MFYGTALINDATCELINSLDAKREKPVLHQMGLGLKNWCKRFDNESSSKTGLIYDQSFWDEVLIISSDSSETEDDIGLRLITHGDKIITLMLLSNKDENGFNFNFGHNTIQRNQLPELQGMHDKPNLRKCCSKNEFTTSHQHARTFTTLDL
eukprot:126073_1